MASVAAVSANQRFLFQCPSFVKSLPDDAKKTTKYTHACQYLMVPAGTNKRSAKTIAKTILRDHTFVFRLLMSLSFVIIIYRGRTLRAGCVRR
jgi:hypothetical protein